MGSKIGFPFFLHQVQGAELQDAQAEIATGTAFYIGAPISVLHGFSQDAGLGNLSAFPVYIFALAIQVGVVVVGDVEMGYFSLGIELGSPDVDGMQVAAWKLDVAPHDLAFAECFFQALGDGYVA